MLHSPSKFNTWLPALFDGQFHWDFLNPCFKGTKIRPMDIDCCIERRGHVLMFETKTTGKEIEVGQAITLTTLWRLGITIIHLEGKTPEDITGFAIYSEWDEPKNYDVGSKKIAAGNSFDLIHRVRQWFCKASDFQPPNRESWDNELWLWDNERS